MLRALVVICFILEFFAANPAEGSCVHSNNKTKTGCADSGPKGAVQALLECVLGGDYEFRILEEYFPSAPEYPMGNRYCAQLIGIDQSEYRMNFVLSASDDGYPSWQRELWASWKTKKRVVVPARRVFRGKILKEKDLSVRVVEIDRESDRYATTFDTLLGTKALGTLIAGRLVPKRLVADPPVVIRGRPVVAQVKVGAMMVTMTGQALEDGAVGELVKVLNTKSKQILQGVVRAEGKVEVY